MTHCVPGQGCQIPPLLVIAIFRFFHDLIFVFNESLLIYCTFGQLDISYFTRETVSQVLLGGANYFIKEEEIVEEYYYSSVTFYFL